MGEAAKDSISNLPDSLLHHILSFLEIKDVARTSVISKRWNSIWTTVPILHLLSTNYTPTSIETDKFMDFVDGTLHRHNSSSVDKFFLFWNAHLNESRLHSWISTVIRGNVKELSLHLSQTAPLFIPLSLFTCESLTSLELGAHPDFTFPKYISMPRLKCLKLRGFVFNNECWNEELFSNSPVLEELILEFCKFCMSNFCISIPTLKLLKIESWDYDDDLRVCALKIHTPNLVTFTYLASVAKEYVLSSFPTLLEAVVNFNSEEGGAEMSRLLRAIAHAECLTVHDITLQAIWSASDLLHNLLIFNNVKMLTISDILTNDSEQGLISFLKAVPNLESLVFDEYIDDDEQEDIDDDNDDTEGVGNDGKENDDADCVEGENNHANEDERDVVTDISEDPHGNEDDCWALEGCFPHLKSVIFQQFVGNPREMRWAKLILKNAEALQMMTVRFYSASYLSCVNVKSEKEITVEIPSFPRASTGCLFKFCSGE